MGKPGTWKKGQSGNPSGKPKAVRCVVELARLQTIEAVKTLSQIMRSKTAPEAARVQAAKELLDRAWGKSTQAVGVAGAEVPSDLASAFDNELAKLFRKA